MMLVMVCCCTTAAMRSYSAACIAGRGAQAKGAERLFIKKDRSLCRAADRSGSSHPRQQSRYPRAAPYSSLLIRWHASCEGIIACCFRGGYRHLLKRVV